MSKEHAYAYEAGYRDGYRDGSTHYELEHCPACKNVADLQEALDENARLRELTQQMFALIENHEETKYMDGELGRQIVNAVYERMKELGIEVNRVSNPISDLRDFLSMSPSVVFPQDVLEYLPAIEAENAKLRELVQDYDKMLEVSLIWCDGPAAPLSDAVHISLRSRMYELGVEVDG